MGKRAKRDEQQQSPRERAVHDLADVLLSVTLDASTRKRVEHALECLRALPVSAPRETLQ